MTQQKPDPSELYAKAEPWVILAVSTFITACYKQNFSVIDLLRSPYRYSGQIDGTVAVIDMPDWFPARESVLEVGGGALHTKLKDTALPANSKKLDGGTRFRIDLQNARLPADMPQTVSLTYFPWFRFLSEPVNYDAHDRVAAYIASCIQFLFRRSGSSANTITSGDQSHVAADCGIVVAVSGMQAMSRFVVSSGALETSFDFANRRISIDRRMFPLAYEAGHAMLQTADRPRGVSIEAGDTHLVLSAMRGA